MPDRNHMSWKWTDNLLQEENLKKRIEIPEKNIGLKIIKKQPICEAKSLRDNILHIQKIWRTKTPVEDTAHSQKGD